MDSEERLQLLLRNVQECVTEDEARALLERSGPKRAYVGIEPSGLFHVGGAIVANKAKDLTALGFDFVVLLADWHAFINDKYGGDIEAIKTSGAFLKDAFLALGCDEDKVKFVAASEYINDGTYWEKVLRISKSSSVARIKRAMTIMGRKEDEADADASKLIYPAMQAADIFHLKLDLALGGMDQRHAHMLARDAAEKLGWKKFVAIHTPLLMSLQGSGRMDAAESKMSKSKPETCIFIHDSPEDIAKKMNAAFCPAKIAEGNPVLEHCKFVVFPNAGKLEVKRPEKFGGDVTFASYRELESAYVDGKLHPSDLKSATAKQVADILAPAREYLARHKGNLEKVIEMAGVKR